VCFGARIKSKGTLASSRAIPETVRFFFVWGLLNDRVYMIINNLRTEKYQEKDFNIIDRTST